MSGYFQVPEDLISGKESRYPLENELADVVVGNFWSKKNSGAYRD
jgi:hypothetical protein